MFLPFIAWMGITDQHFALIIPPLFITPAPTYKEDRVAQSV
jgi:hypothetical protein